MRLAQLNNERNAIHKIYEPAECGLYGWTPENMPEFSPEIVLIDITELSPDIREGWSYVDGAFSPPPLMVFNTPGTCAWVVPAGVTKVWVSGCGGGAGGISESTASGWAIPGGASGGWVIDTELTVTPGASISITIGAGGGTSTGAGKSGGTTSFGSLLTLTGGTGQPTYYTSVAGGTPNGQPGALAKMPTTGSLDYSEGASTPFGVGGRLKTVSATVSEPTTATGYGAGGCSVKSGTATAGAPGLLIIKW